jgi:hypothetical protein
MKLKACLTLGVLLLCAMIAPLSRADEKRDAKLKSEMVENYLLWQIAWKNKDAERIISFESPDFTHYSNQGKKEEIRSKADYDGRLRSEMRKIRKIHNASVKINKLTIEPNRVVILSKLDLDADVAWVDIEPQRVLITQNSREIWVQYDGVWMLKRIEELQGELSFGFMDQLS